MKAQQLSTYIIALNDLVLVQAALDLLRTGQPLTAVQSGTIAFAALPQGVDLGPDPKIYFDGQLHVCYFHFVSG